MTLPARPDERRPAPSRALDAGIAVMVVLLTFGLGWLYEALALPGVPPPVPPLSPYRFLLTLPLAGLLLRAGDAPADFGLRRIASPGLAAGLIVLAVVGELFDSTLLGPLLERLPTGPEPDLARYEVLKGNVHLFLIVLPVMWVLAGFGEELLYRAILMRLLARLMGNRAWATAAALVGQAVVFGLMHSSQGPAGVITNVSSGLILGAVYWASGRNLWVSTVAHGLVNTVALTFLTFS